MAYGSGLPRIMPNLTRHCRPGLAEAAVARWPAPAVVLDMGAGGRKIAPHVVAVDFAALPGTDVVSDVCATPFPDNHADLIIATGLIEHLEDDLAFLREALRVLKPGGEIHVEIPFLQQYHDDPIDVRRYTVDGLARVMRAQGFEPLAQDFHIGPGVALATLNAYYWGMVFEGESRAAKILSNGAFFVASVLGWPLTRLDRWLMRKRSAHRLAFGVYCAARKPTS